MRVEVAFSGELGIWTLKHRIREALEILKRLTTYGFEVIGAWIEFVDKVVGDN
jgi:hypothetical protein